MQRLTKSSLISIQKKYSSFSTSSLTSTIFLNFKKNKNHLNYLKIFQRNVITERSFVADELKAIGVKVEPAPKEPLIEATPEMLDQPNERVKKLVDEVLNLNMLEISMFFKAMQV